MWITVAFALIVCLAALVLGQSVLRLCGAQRWSWLAAPIGICVMILFSAWARSAPGGSLTTAVVLGLGVAAAAVHTVPHRAHRPPVLGLLAGAVVFALALVPFAAAGRSGTLGMSFNNDMSLHLLWADGYRSAEIATVATPFDWYPLGVHSLVGTLARALGTSVEPAFAGLSIALVVLLGWTALSALRAPRWWGVFATAPLVGMTYLIAGYYGQGAFKEVLQALLILGVASFVAFSLGLSKRLRWVPLGLLIGGILSAYSLPGLAWPVAILGIWVAGVIVRGPYAADSSPGFLARARGEAMGVVIGAGALLLALAPQLPRLLRFAETTLTNGSVIQDVDIGNLAGPIPLWEAFGAWDSPDFRVAGPTPFENGMWTALVVGLVIVGVGWAFRRNEWVLPGAAGAGLLIWAVSDGVQSPYVTAKALVVVAPLLMLTALRPWVERGSGAREPLAWQRFAGPAVVVVLIVKCLGSSWGALTFSKVGTSAHANEIRSLLPSTEGRPTLFLGNDDFTQWIFGAVPVKAPVIGFPVLELRPEKPWVYGRNYDVDSIDSATLNDFDWVIAPRDAAASTFPPEFVLARQTRNFWLYHRTGTVPPTRVLQEGEAAAAVLDCSTPTGRSISQSAGIAAVRRGPVSTEVPALPPGSTLTVHLTLERGQWDLVAPYIGPRPILISAPGLEVTLPPNLARPGPRWPIGRITVTRRGPVPITIRPSATFLTPDSALTTMASIIAVPANATRTVPISAACGRLVDWYRPAAD